MGVMRRCGNAVVFSGHDKDKVAYCQDCLDVSIVSPIKYRIYLDENGKITNPAADADNAGHVVL
jgi:hypothetical protein